MSTPIDNHDGHTGLSRPSKERASSKGFIGTYQRLFDKLNVKYDPAMRVEKGQEATRKASHTFDEHRMKQPEEAAKAVKGNVAYINKGAKAFHKSKEKVDKILKGDMTLEEIEKFLAVNPDALQFLQSDSSVSREYRKQFEKKLEQLLRSMGHGPPGAPTPGGGF